MAKGEKKATKKKVAKKKIAKKKEVDKKVVKKKMGRPTKYRESFCEDLKEHMAGGLSFECFGPAIGVAQSSVENWIKVHEKFLGAKKEGFALSRDFYEKVGRQGMLGKIPGFNTTVWIFNMKNRFMWRDKHDITSGEKSLAPVEEMSDIELNQKVIMALKVVERNESRSSSRNSKGKE